MDESPESSMLGAVLGDYEVLQELGRGGMGVVYKARQISLDRPVAMKVLPGNMVSDEEFINRFLREARAAARLVHPNVIQVFDAGVVENVYFFVMEFAEGQDLANVLKERKHLKESEALYIIQEAAKGLAYAHTLGMVHRDIKPANLMLVQGKMLKIGDLGLAKWKAHEDESALTVTGTTMGTPFYISPEQIRGQEDLDGRADIYSLGMTLYHFVNGKPPFYKGTGAEIMAQHLTEEVKLDSLPSEISQPTRELIRGMVEKDREARIQTMAEVVAEITAIISQKPSPRRNTKNNASKKASKKSVMSGNLPGWVTAVVFLILAAMVGIFAWKLRQVQREVPSKTEVVEAVVEKAPPQETASTLPGAGEISPVPGHPPSDSIKPPENASHVEPERHPEVEAAHVPEKAAELEKPHPLVNQNVTPELLVEQVSPSEFHSAAVEGRLERIDEILKQGVKVDLPNEKGQTALMFASNFGNMDSLKKLLENKADINKMDQAGLTPFIYAVDRGHVTAATLLADRGADINHQNVKKQTPLMRATFDGREEMVDFLISRKVGLELRDENGLTALSYAVLRNHPSLVEKLVKAGARVGNADPMGVTPLMQAVTLEGAAPEMIRTLLKVGASPEVSDGKGNTPLSHAVDRGNLEAVRILADAHRLSVNLADHAGRTPIMKAAAGGDAAMVNFLGDKGADLNARDSNNGGTALHFAVGMGKLNAVDALIKRRMDLNARDRAGKTPLMIAAFQGNYEMVELLMQKGAQRQGVLEAAVQGRQMASNRPDFPREALGGYDRVIEYLRKSGAR